MSGLQETIQAAQDLWALQIAKQQLERRIAAKDAEIARLRAALTEAAGVVNWALGRASNQTWDSVNDFSKKIAAALSPSTKEPTQRSFPSIYIHAPNCRCPDGWTGSCGDMP